MSHDRSAAPTGATPSHETAGTRPSDPQPLQPTPSGYAPGSLGAPAAPSAPTAPIPSAVAPVAKRGKATPILAALAVLLFLALAAVTALFLINDNNSDETIASQKSQIETLERQAKDKDDDLAKVNQDLATAKSQADALQKSSAACNKAVQDFFNAVKNDNEAAGTTAAFTIQRECKGVNVF